MRLYHLLLVVSLASACAATPTTEPTPTLPTITATPAATATAAPTATPLPPTATLVPSPTPAPTVDRAAEWREDLYLLADFMLTQHPDLFWRTNEDDFRGMVDRLDAQLPDLRDDEVMVELTRLVSVADQHSFMPLFQAAVDFQVYPLRLYQFSDGLFVVSADEPHGDLAGARVTHIGQMGAEAALAAVAPLVPRDNEMTTALLTPVYVIVPEVLLALDIIDDPAAPGFVLERPDGTQTTLNVEPVSGEQYRDWLSTHMILAGLPQSPEALWLSRKADEYYWYTYLEDSRTLYIQYNLVVDLTQSGQNIYRFSDEVDEFATQHLVERTVVDVRHNIGGGNFMPLVEALRGNPVVNQPGRLFVLIGRQTLSAGMRFALELQTTTHALLVGEPTGTRPNFYAEQRQLTLINSRIDVLISGTYVQASIPDDTRPWLEPDLPVTLTSADYFAGRDPVLEAALAADAASQ